MDKKKHGIFPVIKLNLMVFFIAVETLSWVRIFEFSQSKVIRGFYRVGP